MWKNSLKNILNHCLPLTKESFLFTYHDISPKTNPAHHALVSTEPERFYEQIEALESWGFRFVSLSELLSSKEERLVHITFDDGFLGVWQNAHSHLKQKKIPYTVFLNATAWQQDKLFYGEEYPDLSSPIASRRYLQPEEIAVMHRDGVHFASHGYSHKALSQLSKEDLLVEIRENKKQLQSLGLTFSPHFALPYGKKRHFNEESLVCLRQEGYEYIYSSNPMPVRSGDKCIPRISLLNQNKKELLWLLQRTQIFSYDL